MKYWINEDGTERKASKKDFTYWLKNFCLHVTTEKGYTIKLINEKQGYIRPFPKIEDIYCGYNPRGVKICGKLE